ncbi:MAG: hypothetical protein IKY71_04855, partial [Bacteroidaceae bacterium]|nr:hypothetical protein [Bacteroidaceae bacterium]
MSKLTNLLPLAATVRDATEEHENSASRIGGLFVSLIQALIDTMPEAQIDGASLGHQASESNFIISMKKRLNDGTEVPLNITIPAASTANAGLLTPSLLTELRTALNSAVNAANTAQNSADSANHSIASINTTVTSLQNGLASVETTVLQNVTNIEGLYQNVTDIYGQIGKPSGIATLDAMGKVPAANLPAFVDDVVEFKAFTSETNVEPGIIAEMAGGIPIPVYFSSTLNRFVAHNYEDNKFFSNWPGEESFQSNYIPVSGKVFLCKDDGKCYRWSGSQLAAIGSDLTLGETANTAFPGSRGVVLEQQVSSLLGSSQSQNLTVVNVNTWKKTPTTVYDLEAVVLNLVNAGRLSAGMVVVYLSQDGWVAKQFIGVNTIQSFENLDNWKDFGGSSVGNIYNVTTEMPISGYYSLCDTENVGKSAVHLAWTKKKAALGLILSFEIAAGTWKTYQFVGKSLTEEQWINPENWKDFGSLAAGSEPFIIIDNIVGAPTFGNFYTLESALTALLAHQKEKGLTYAKPGLVISYKVAENKMETRQFQGSIADFNEPALWSEFGGGSRIELSDVPEVGSGKAFSAEGARHYLPSNLVVDTETEGVVKISMQNADGDTVGDEIQFPVGTGTSGGSATIVAIAFKNSPLYGAYGANIATSAAIRSVSSATGVETENSIERIELVDRDTNITVFTQTVNQQSSADLNDYSFPIDFTQFFTAAGSKKYRLVAYDDTGATGSKNITVTAVDVTCTSVQVLQYSADNPITPTTTSASVPLYKFANNQSDKGISAQVDIKIGGEWQPLATAVVHDSFTHSVTIRPTELGLTHGSYPIRVQGTDIASGTKGNTIYSAIMVVDEDNTTPIVSIRYDDANN